MEDREQPQVVRIVGDTSEVIRPGLDLGVDPGFLPPPELMSFPTRAELWVNIDPVTCIPSPESPANRMTTFGMRLLHAEPCLGVCERQLSSGLEVGETGNDGSHK